MDYQFDDPFILQASIVDAEDVTQEMELLRLQGITPNRRIVKMRLSQHSDLLFQGDPGTIAKPIATTTLPPAQVIEMLVSWAIQQSDEISKAILDFLEEPSMEDAETLVRKLKRAGLTAPTSKTSHRGTLSDALTAYIGEKGRTKDELYDYARAIHRAERPEAAVRQFIRRAVKEQSIVLTDGRYVLAITTKEGT